MRRSGVLYRSRDVVLVTMPRKRRCSAMSAIRLRSAMLAVGTARRRPRHGASMTCWGRKPPPCRSAADDQSELVMRAIRAHASCRLRPVKMPLLHAMICRRSGIAYVDDALIGQMRRRAGFRSAVYIYFIKKRPTTAMPDRANGGTAMAWRTQDGASRRHYSARRLPWQNTFIYRRQVPAYATTHLGRRECTCVIHGGRHFAA